MAVNFIGGGNRSTRETHQPVASHRQTLLHNVVSSTTRLSGVLTTLVVIGIDCTGSYKLLYNHDHDGPF